MREKTLLSYSEFKSLGSSLEKTGVVRLVPRRFYRVELQLSVFWPNASIRIFHHIQEDDPDAPDETVAVQISKYHKTISGQEKRITKKIYTLKDKSFHIMEIEEK